MRLRHTIYTAMLGLLLATGMTLSSWQTLGIAVACFVGGTRYRIRVEERLLRQRFGAVYDHYAASVPAFPPWPLSSRGLLHCGACPRGNG
jgi:protein-S-isoprenylcysteine O-methyltransferase Ste14